MITIKFSVVYKWQRCKIKVEFQNVMTVMGIESKKWQESVVCSAKVTSLEMM